jgi:hypothetical protein
MRLSEPEYCEWLVTRWLNDDWCSYRAVDYYIVAALFVFMLIGVLWSLMKKHRGEKLDRADAIGMVTLLLLMIGAAIVMARFS